MILDDFTHAFSFFFLRQPPRLDLTASGFLIRPILCCYPENPERQHGPRHHLK